ncbi:hypothetical protein H8699_08905 [Christensenellaceae bacterium NSJ-44]|uniref:Uncharacterized protein n=1 Tax=Luoshenia tenuis TaxID=2763654 RepID=A0A926D1B4_9FIRM|nr:hypothetical protein [Luoshenia tenuis]MBC8529542.1 hypothetical protein [Luoshenia tenuis]
MAETIKMVIESSSWMSEALKMTEGLEIYKWKGGWYMGGCYCNQAVAYGII